ncbi:MAG TPA: hypothetical protein VIH30_01985, partial [Aquirhabdus sp.]
MEFFSTPWQVFSAAGVAIGGALFCIKISKAFDVSSKRALLLYVWHTLFCVVYARYVVSNGGDAITYYQSSLTGNMEFSLGTQFVRIFTAWFSYVLGFSFYGTFLVYNVIGFIGLLAGEASLRIAVSGYSRRVRNFAGFIVFLPSISFWSSGIGKDAISFMAAGIVLWAALDLRRRTRLLFSAILLMFLVRPHMAALLLVAFAGSMLFQRSMSFVQRVLLVSVVLGAAAALVPVAIKYVG